MTVLSWFITAFVVALLVGFVVYLVSLRRLKVVERVEVTVYDRLGRPQGKTEAAPPERR